MKITKVTERRYPYSTGYRVEKNIDYDVPITLLPRVILQKNPEYGQYIASVDPYKVTDGNSIAEVYIYKRDTGEQVYPDITWATGTTTLT